MSFYLRRRGTSLEETCGQSAASSDRYAPFDLHRLPKFSMDESNHTGQLAAGLGRRITASQSEHCQDFVIILSRHCLVW